MVGSEISHYRILEELGAGGMGVVYKAVDLHLERTVALKFLSPFLTSDPESRLRFIHEAKAASALQHENICTIHDIDQTPDGRLYIVMDCYQGETLKARTRRSAMPLNEVVRVATQIARGLACAHAHGIVHRDIKSENVFLTADGTVKILDFGLAKLAGHSITQAHGIAMGTVAAMSPEQIADDTVGASTDIWSFGVVLYEMLTGQPPFRGQLAAAIMYAILHDELPPVSSLNDSIPAYVSDLCMWCLAKNPADRPASMKAVLARLQGDHRAKRTIRLRRTAWLAALCIAIAAALYGLLRTRSPVDGARATPATLAILQFKDLSHDPAAAGWPDVIQSIMVSSLTGIEELRVYDPIGPNTVSARTLAEGVMLASSAGAPHMPVIEYTFEGSILKHGGRFVLQLNVRALTNEEILASFSTTIGNESEIPRIVDSLSLAGLGVVQSAAGIAPGAAHLQPWWPQRFRSVEALKAFGQACRLALQGNSVRSEDALQRTIALDSCFIAPRVWLVTRMAARGDTAAAAAYLHRLLALRDSTSPFDRMIIDWAKACVDDSLDAQIAALQRALEYSPGNAILLYSLGRAKYLRQDYRGCVNDLQPVIDREWEYPSLYLLAAQSYDMLEEYDAERAALTSALALDYPPPEAHYYMATLYRRADNPSAAAEEDNAFIRAMAERGAAMRSIYLALSDINIAEGFHTEGMAYYRRVVADRSESPVEHVSRGDSLCADGDTLHALVEYVRALAVDSTNAPATFRLARACETVGLSRWAFTYYSRCIGLDSASADASYARSRITTLLH